MTIEDLHFQKTDNGGQNLVFPNPSATNLIVRNNKFSGIYDPEPNLSGTSRAFNISTAGFQFINNEITNLRQPGYINPAATTGLIQGNHIDNTRGWVIEEGNVTFEDNTWGELSDSNYLDIVILNTVDVPNYPDVVALSVANSEVVVDDQRPGTGPVRSCPRSLLMELTRVPAGQAMALPFNLTPQSAMAWLVW